MTDRPSDEEIARLRALAHAIENKHARQFSQDEYMWLLTIIPKLLAEREALLEEKRVREAWASDPTNPDNCASYDGRKFPCTCGRH